MSTGNVIRSVSLAAMGIHGFSGAVIAVSPTALIGNSFRG